MKITPSELFNTIKISQEPLNREINTLRRGLDELSEKIKEKNTIIESLKNPPSTMEEATIYLHRLGYAIKSSAATAKA